MPTTQPPTDDALTGAYAAIIGEARAQVAAGREPDVEALQEHIRAAGRLERARGEAHTKAADKAEQKALQQLARVLTVHRARAVAAREPERPLPTAAPVPRRPVLRAKPTISGNMDVRRQARGDAVVLRWDAARGVAGWEVRFSERADARSDYVLRETLTLPASATELELPLGERALRVHLLGRGRDGRLIRRAIISALTRESWNDRWQRRASAA